MSNFYWNEILFTNQRKHFLQLESKLNQTFRILNNGRLLHNILEQMRK